jgi:hypothetical protein
MTYTPCTHGFYYDCPRGCEDAHLAGDEVAIEAARKFRAYRFDHRLDTAAATAQVARNMGMRPDQVGPMVNKGLGLIERHRD